MRKRKLASYRNMKAVIKALEWTTTYKGSYTCVSLSAEGATGELIELYSILFKPHIKQGNSTSWLSPIKVFGRLDAEEYSQKRTEQLLRLLDKRNEWRLTALAMLLAILEQEKEETLASIL